MARYDVPRPKRSSFTYRTLSGKWFDSRAYENAVAEWERDRDEFSQRQRSSYSAIKRGVQGAGLAAGIAITGAQAYEEPTQDSTNTQGNYADSEAENRRSNQARGHRRDTTYKGRQRGGSSQNG